MNQNIGDIQERSKQFALRIIQLYGQLPRNHRVAEVIGDQLLRSGTSIGAQLCEAQAASSRKEFAYKVELAEREGRETQYWLWLLMGAQIFPEAKLTSLYDESSQIVAIVTTIGKNVRSRRTTAKTLLSLLLGLF